MYDSDTPLIILPGLTGLPDSLEILSCYNCPYLLIQRRKKENRKNYQARWKVIHEILRRDEIIKRCKAIKEDLMIKTWHPSRLMNWCLDEEDRLDMLSYGD